MQNKTANFKEEFSSKIPALTLLTNLGYTFIPPIECEVLRANTLATGKKSLMQQLLTGKHRVKIDDKEVA